ncbi:hypothetical protein PGIGA_G00117940 [Pangasianodon gigas]|uniref:Uncharacterized protein n=1 Tax=Pangasianodon gigas TaxID=30993 RepID=A0ACC5XFM1_PANGG|nr:hypothetical protein [Pangasianodon gigas]
MTTECYNLTLLGRKNYNSQDPSLTRAPPTQTVPTPQQPVTSCLLLITSAGGCGEIWRVKVCAFIAWL